MLWAYGLTVANRTSETGIFAAVLPALGAIVLFIFNLLAVIILLVQFRRGRSFRRLVLVAAAAVLLSPIGGWWLLNQLPY